MSETFVFIDKYVYDLYTSNDPMINMYNYISLLYVLETFLIKDKQVYDWWEWDVQMTALSGRYLYSIIRKTCDKSEAHI